MRGFTLLEVIIALIIAGMAAVALFEAVGTGLRATQTASMYDQAIVRAKSRLAAAAHGTKLTPGLARRRWRRLPRQAWRRLRPDPTIPILHADDLSAQCLGRGG